MKQERSFNLRRPRSGGFTFTEVLFAVILLGIGFIMLAGIFPVAVQQTVTTAEETAANSLAQRAVTQIAAIATTSRFPSTGGKVRRLQPVPAPPLDAWTALAGNMIDEKNPRYAWVPMYRREAGNRYMQLIVVAIQAQHDGQVFETGKDFYRQGSSALVEPRSLKMTVELGPRNEYEMKVKKTETYQDACAGGVYVVHADTGKYFRLGLRADEDAQHVWWSIAPGHDLSEEDVKNWASSDQDALILGRPFVSRDPANPGTAVQGYPMDIGLYSTFILLK